MDLKPNYDITDCGDELQVGLYLDDFQVGNLLIVQDIGEDQAMLLAQNLGDCFVASMRPRSVGLSPSKP